MAVHYAHTPTFDEHLERLDAEKVRRDAELLWRDTREKCSRRRVLLLRALLEHRAP